MEEPSVQTNSRIAKLKNIVVQVVSILIEVSCLIVVFVQTYRCASKYAQYPQGTRIKIIEGDQRTYPDVTICPLYESDFVSILEKCNLTHAEYFTDGIWRADGFESFCNDPKELFNKLSNSTFEDFKMWYVSFDDGEYYVAEDFKYKEIGDFGRCLTFIYPENRGAMWELSMSSNQSGFQVFISTPGYFISTEYHSVLLEPNFDLTVKVNREVMEVLDYEGQPCVTTQNRDACIYDYIEQNLTDTVGCTTPFVPDKSKICTNATQAKTALRIENSIFTDIGKLQRLCPRSCSEIHADFGSKEKYPIDEGPGKLTLEFHQFVKVSKSYWEYDGIELVAEVGGYVGLFLGVSVNQVKLLIERFFTLYE